MPFTFLKEEETVQALRQELEIFLSTNKKGDTLNTSRWGALKASIRGWVQQKTGIQRRLKAKKSADLIENIAKQEALLFQASLEQAETVPFEKQIIKYRMELAALENSDILANLMHVKRLNFVEGDKPGANLAWKLRQERLGKMICSIRTAQGQVVTSSTDINGAFCQFYRDLYREGPVVSPIVSILYLNRVSLPKLINQDSQLLDTPISGEEILLAISKMKKLKAPGPDGFPDTFFCTISRSSC